MAARNRPRNGIAKDDGADAHEERTMWNSIVNDLRKLKSIQVRASDVAKQQVELETRLAKSPDFGAGQPREVAGRIVFDGSGTDILLRHPAPTVKDIDELQELYREGVRLAEEESRMLNEEPSDVIKNVGILSALRSASEAEPVRAASNTKQRNPKRQKIDTDGASDSPSVPSPGVTPAVNKVKGQNVMRSVSVPRQPLEPSIKVEEGAESTKSPSVEKGGRLVIGAEVAYKQTKPKEDAQWIQCEIVNITGEGSKRRYEVQDPEPDENGHTVPIYKTTAAALIPIPGPDAILPEFNVGKHVLARYPETTTFYRAEVRGMKKDMYRLSFEDDQNQENEVHRRFVLELPGR